MGTAEDSTGRAPRAQRALFSAAREPLPELENPLQQRDAWSTHNERSEAHPGTPAFGRFNFEAAERVAKDEQESKQQKQRESHNRVPGMSELIREMQADYDSGARTDYDNKNHEETNQTRI